MRFTQAWCRHGGARGALKMPAIPGRPQGGRRYGWLSRRHPFGGGGPAPGFVARSEPRPPILTIATLSSGGSVLPVQTASASLLSDKYAQCDFCGDDDGGPGAWGWMRFTQAWCRRGAGAHGAGKMPAVPGRRSQADPGGQGGRRYGWLGRRHPFGGGGPAPGFVARSEPRPPLLTIATLSSGGSVLPVQTASASLRSHQHTHG